MTKKKEWAAPGRRSGGSATLFFFILSLAAITLNYRGNLFAESRALKRKKSKIHLRDFQERSERRRGGGVFCAGTNICRKFQLLKQLLAVIVWHVQELSTTGFKQKYKAEINTARGGINLRDVRGRWIKHVLLLLLLCYSRARRWCYQEAPTLTLHLYGEHGNTVKIRSYYLVKSTDPCH